MRWVALVLADTGPLVDGAHLVAELILAGVIAFIIGPLAKIATRLRAIEVRLAYIEGKISGPGGQWSGEDRRMVRPGAD